MNESNLKWMALISRTQELTLMFATIAAAFLTQTICLDDTTVKFEIWDTGTSTWTRSMNVELVSNFFSLVPPPPQPVRKDITVWRQCITGEPCLFLAIQIFTGFHHLFHEDDG